MDTLYKPLILDNSNWNEFRSKLHLFPLRMSKLNNLESTINVKSISLKYVLKGIENYTLAKKQYGLTQNQFVITNKHSDCKVRINENHSSGICIDLKEFYFSDIIHSIYFPNEIDSLNQNISFFLSDELFSQGWFASGNLQLMLKQLASYSQNKIELCFKEDYLRNITHEIIFSQQKIIKEYNNLSVIKPSTKKELYARLLKAKNLILDGTEISIKEIANTVCLSEFRFHHLFKEAFGITPLRFQTKVMIDKAIKLFSMNKFTWTEVSEKLGYSDIQTFSKIFKRVYGVSPKNFSLDI